MDREFVRAGSILLVPAGADAAHPGHAYRLRITKVHDHGHVAPGRARLTGHRLRADGRSAGREPRLGHVVIDFTRCRRADLVLRWVGKDPLPDRLCLGCHRPAPIARTLEDQHGWLWCAFCADHITTCDDTSCDHPGAIYANEEAALRVAVRDCRFPARIDAAFALIRDGKIRHSGIAQLYLATGSDGHTEYKVDPYACGCPCGQKDDSPCKHRVAVLMLEAKAKQAA